MGKDSFHAAALAIVQKIDETALLEVMDVTRCPCGLTRQGDGVHAEGGSISSKLAPVSPTTHNTGTPSTTPGEVVRQGWTQGTRRRMAETDFPNPLNELNTLDAYREHTRTVKMASQDLAKATGNKDGVVQRETDRNDGEKRE